MKNDKRQKLLVDRQLQGALAVRILLHWLSFLVVSVSLMFLFTFLSNPLESAGTHFDRVWDQHRYFLIVAVVMLPLFVYDSLQLSNRFAGPILRFRKLIQRIGTGEPVEKIKFREGDFWHDLSKDLNAMLDRIQDHPGSTPVAEETPKARGRSAARAEASAERNRQPETVGELPELHEVG